MEADDDAAGMDFEAHAGPAVAGHGDEDIQVPASDVLVQGQGGMGEVLRILDDIAAAVCNSRSRSSVIHTPSQASRKYNSKNEFNELVQRIKRKDAEVVLRKLFLYRGSCNVEQEIWIKDPGNPEATLDPLKSYSIVHSHQHAQVSRVSDVKPEHLDVVDAMNVRHLAADGRGCQGDNPFFNTYIEPSGTTLKVFPREESWTCRVCSQSNYQTKAFCRGWRGASCTGSRPCTAWRWKEERWRDEGLALILQSADAALQWTSGSGKSMARGGDSSASEAGAKTFGLEDLRLQYLTPRTPRKDLRKTPDRSISELPTCNTCNESPCSQSCRSWCGLRAAVLCIGVSEYSHISRLPNALRDARALEEQANAVGSCRAELLENPSDIQAMSRAMKGMLSRDGLKEHPPWAVVIVLSGHNMQQGAKVYFLPAGANPSHPGCDPDVEFLELATVWKFCKQLDDHARSLTPPQEITFQVLVDGCRDGEAMLNSASLGSILDPPRGEAPKRWALGFSCSRQSVAMDGAPGGHSPFAEVLLDRQTGIFAKGMPLKKALETAIRRMRDGAGTNGQAPFAASLEAIDDHFCINPDESSLGISHGEISEADCNEVVTFLKGKGLSKIAERFSDVMGLEVVDQLAKLKDEDFDDPAADLSFLLRWQRRELMQIVRDLTACALSMTHDSSDDSGLADLQSPGAHSALSQADTLSTRENDSETAGTLSSTDTSSVGGGAGVDVSADNSSESESVAIKHDGSPEEFNEHMHSFIKDFLDLRPFVEADPEWDTYDVALGASGGGQWTLCMLLWIRFMRDKSEVLDSACRKTWQHACRRSPSQQRLVDAFNSCLLSQSSLGHEWNREAFDGLGCSKDGAACVFVTDRFVQKNLGTEEVRARWQAQVVHDWFSSDDEPAADFLVRANRFLREHIVYDISILQTPVKTRSYVAFMRMHKLASVLFSEFCELCIPDTDPSSATANSASSPGRQGFRVFASSSRRICSLTRADAPAAGAKAALFGGLQCLARLSEQAWAMLGPAKTVREYAAEMKALAVEDCAAMHKATDFDPGDGAAGGGGGGAAAHSEDLRETLGAIFGDAIALSSLQAYLTSVREAVSSYVDSASGESRGVDGESIPLALFSHEAFDDVCGADDAATQRDLCCPITSRIMQDPVRCSDGHTYERSAIQQWFRAHDTSPMTRETLACEPGDDKRLKYVADAEMVEKIREFKKRKHDEEEQRKQDAEGEEEKRIFCQRLGLLADGMQEEKGDSDMIESADGLLHLMLDNSSANCACLVGPPASGKTVTMLQIVFAAVQDCSAKVEQGTGLVPLFMRAAELAALLSYSDQTVGDLRQLVQLFLNDYVQKVRLERGVVNVMMELFDSNLLLICIDGLDEAAGRRELIETCIDTYIIPALTDARMPRRVLISTREHSYTNSRAMRRLGGFGVVKLQPLDESHQHAMIVGRVEPEHIQDFQQQLASSAEHNPELATSPFLLSLMIEVYREHGALPSQRVELYAKQVEGIVKRCVNLKLDEGFKCQLLGRGDDASAKALAMACEYLEALAFVCQMRVERRDFTLAACSQDLRGLWDHDARLLADARELVFSDPMVGLLSRVDSDTFRFSHLTLQEYLAAKCTVRRYGRDAGELVKVLAPFHSRWRREVLQFTACMLDETVFEALCEKMLLQDDGAGANCELVRAFLKERKSTEIERMLTERLLELRGTENLVAGLCHPSWELRELLLSEMRQFRTPADPIADGTAAKLTLQGTLKARGTGAVQLFCLWCR